MSLGKIWQCHEQSRHRLKKKLINLSWRDCFRLRNFVFLSKGNDNIPWCHVGVNEIELLTFHFLLYLLLGPSSYNSFSHRQHIGRRAGL